MTLIIAGVNRDYAAIVADCRLSRGKDNPVADGVRKIGVAHASDGSFLFGFCGFASYGSFSTFDWCCRTLLASGPDAASATNNLFRLTRQITSFQTLQSIPRRDCGITFVLVGYAAGDAFRVTISNYECGETLWAVPKQEFMMHHAKPTDYERFAIVSRHGFSSALPNERFTEIGSLMGRDAPVTAFCAKAATMIRAVSLSGFASAAVGAETMSVSLARAAPRRAVGRYNPELPASDAVPVPVVLDLVTRQGFSGSIKGEAVARRKVPNRPRSRRR